MPIQSLNWNDKIRNLAGGDNLSDLQKKSLMDQYNSNIPGIQNQLGYLANYGATTNPSRSAVQVINSAYDTSGNGGRKLVRLSNGWLVNGVKDTSAFSFKLYVSKDNGATWTYLAFRNYSSGTADFSLQAIGITLYLITTFSIDNTVNYYKITDFSTSGVNLGLPITTIDTQTAIGNCSLAYSPTDNTLHAAWASKNATYPNSFNIRYTKGTINGDGSVTWGSVTQITTFNTSGADYTNPSIVIFNGNPCILNAFNQSTTNNFIQCWKYNGTTWTAYIVGGVNGFTQSSPSATVDGNGVIHVVWQGRDATDTAQDNIRYSKSTDGGVTWSAMIKLTSGNSYTQNQSSITYDQNNNVYVYWMGRTATSGGMYNIRSIKYDGATWGSITEVTNQSSNFIQYPSLCDNVRTFTSPLVIYQNLASPSVRFSGTWTDTPLLSETTSTSAVSNKALIDAIVMINKIGNGSKKFASGTLNSSSSDTFYRSFDNTGETRIIVNVTGLTFKPSFIIVRLASYDGACIVYDSRFSQNYRISITNTKDTSSVTGYSFREDGVKAYVNSTSFRLPSLGSGNFEWVAFE